MVPSQSKSTTRAWKGVRPIRQGSYQRWERADSGRRGLADFVAHGQEIVAFEREIVEARGVCSPAWGVGVFGAHHVSCRAHLHAAEAERPVDECDFEFDGHSRLDDARGERIDSARADIARDE